MTLADVAVMRWRSPARAPSQSWSLAKDSQDFRDSKHVHMDYVIGAKPYWFPYRYDRPPDAT